MPALPESVLEYESKAAQCRRLARATTDQRMLDTLLELAREYEDRAKELREGVFVTCGPSR